MYRRLLDRPRRTPPTPPHPKPGPIASLTHIKYIQYDLFNVVALQQDATSPLVISLPVRNGGRDFIHRTKKSKIIQTIYKLLLLRRGRGEGVACARWFRFIWWYICSYRCSTLSGTQQSVHFLWYQYSSSVRSSQLLVPPLPLSVLARRSMECSSRRLTEVSGAVLFYELYVVFFVETLLGLFLWA